MGYMALRRSGGCLKSHGNWIGVLLFDQGSAQRAQYTDFFQIFTHRTRGALRFF